MKKVIALILVLVLLLCMVGCGVGVKKPKGVYSAEIAGMTWGTLTFSGNKVESRNLATDEVEKGKFTVSGTTVTIEYEDGGTDVFIYDPDEETLDLGGFALLRYRK